MSKPLAYKPAICAFFNHTCGKCGAQCLPSELHIRDTEGRPRPEKEQYRGYLKKVYESLNVDNPRGSAYGLWCGYCVALVPKTTRPRVVRPSTTPTWEVVAKAAKDLTKAANYLGEVLAALSGVALPAAEGRLVSDEELERRLLLAEEDDSPTVDEEYKPYDA